MSNPMENFRPVNVMACMTCPLCDKILVQATTISLCLHTFCKTCIYERLSDDECDTCPVCDVSLGCNPVDKLRPDHIKQDIRAKLYPLKRKRGMIMAPEAAPSASPPAKRKKRSLSSLVVDAPRVSAHAGATGRRTRAANRKSSAPRGSSPSACEPHSDDGHMEGPSSPETLRKIIRNKKLASSSFKSSGDHNPNEGAGNNSADGRVDLWKPLNCLVEAANRTKFSKSNSAGTSHAGAGPSFSQGAGADADGLDGDENEVRAETREDSNGSASAPLLSKRKRLRQPNRNAAAASGDMSNSSQLVVDVMRHHRQNVPIWFSLVASEDQEGAVPLPQISSAFLRIKNGDMPVSSIQKYIAKKLELANEDEVQIVFQGRAVLPSLQLRNLLDMWLRAAPSSRRIKTSVGSSGKEFVMVLNYSRRAQAQAQPQAQAQAQAQQPHESSNN